MVLVWGTLEYNPLKVSGLILLGVNFGGLIHTEFLMTLNGLPASVQCDWTLKLVGSWTRYWVFFFFKKEKEKPSVINLRCIRSNFGVYSFFIKNCNEKKFIGWSGTRISCCGKIPQFPTITNHSYQNQIRQS
jgi:hypothetical protein